jgi:four helix bundle protein
VPLVRDFKELRVYQVAFEAAMRIFELSKAWPAAERYALTDQVRRSSRSVCANIAEAWRKRLYVPSFVSKLSDANAEAAETQVWLDFARGAGYLAPEAHTELFRSYEQVAGGLIKMITEAEAWCGPASVREGNGHYDLDTPDASSTETGTDSDS